MHLIVKKFHPVVLIGNKNGSANSLVNFFILGVSAYNFPFSISATSPQGPNTIIPMNRDIFTEIKNPWKMKLFYAKGMLHDYSQRLLHEGFTKMPTNYNTLSFNILWRIKHT